MLLECRFGLESFDGTGVWNPFSWDLKDCCYLDGTVRSPKFHDPSFDAKVQNYTQ